MSLKRPKRRAYAVNTKRNSFLIFDAEPGHELFHVSEDPSIRVEDGRIYVSDVPVGTVEEGRMYDPLFDPLLWRWMVG